MDFKIHTIKCPLKYAYSICFMFTQKTFYKKCLKIKTCFLKMEAAAGIHDENITLAKWQSNPSDYNKDISRLDR